MILESLRQLSLREGLVDDPAFESKPVRWVIDLKTDGSFLAVHDTNQTPPAKEGSKSKPRPQSMMMDIPRRCLRTSGVAADFLVDNAKYALGLLPDGEPTDAKTQLRHADFVKLLQEAEAATHHFGLQATLGFLANPDAVRSCAAALTEQGGFASNDLFTFDVDGDKLHKQSAIRAWWSGRLSGSGSGQCEQQCLLCGEAKVLAANHATLQLRGAVTAGVPLISFNASAFEKYGLSGNDNAPFCRDCMMQYSEALRRLTRPRYVIASTGDEVSRLSITLTDDTTAVYWSDKHSELVEQLGHLNENPRLVTNLLFSPHTGTPFALSPDAKFFCMVLTGAQGRAIVRKIHTGTVAEVARNLVRYFEAIDVERYDRSAPLPLYLLLKSMVLRGELKRLPAETATDLWMAAIFGDPLDRGILAAVVTRNRAEQEVTKERAALLQFYFRNRADRLLQKTKENTLPMSLDTSCTDKSYLLGRLLAVLENLQTAAQGRDLNRTIVDRFYGAASTRPGVVFPQLIKLGMHHLSKAERDAPGRAVNLNKQLGEIIDGLNASDGFGATLSLEDQGRFAIGYYHQRQSFFPKNKQSESASEFLQGELTA